MYILEIYAGILKKINKGEQKYICFFPSPHQMTVVLLISVLRRTGLKADVCALAHCDAPIYSGELLPALVLFIV